ncbi:MAG: ABC transporter substrate-binding protein [Caldilineales bacterium]|nr:ABC transporter substrate-binding protein [Caldilineales bacterium]
MSRNKWMILIAFLVLGVLVLSACATAAPAEPQVVVQTVVVEKEKIVESTVVVEKEVQVEVTSTPAPMDTGAPRPDTYTFATFGDVDTLDPNLAYDTASGTVLFNVMESLIFYNGEDATTFVPVLAKEVPSLENGLISEDGLTYIFNIREGVKFHEGGDLTPSDVAYTFQRGLLQSDPNGPQWLLIEPLLGYASGDVTEEIAEGAYAGDPDALKANATPEELQMVCDKVMAAVVADDAAGTVTFSLAQPWGPFLATLVPYWGSIMDKEWALEQGAWDGTCETWVDHYAPGSENDELSEVVNGTGPYKLESWTPGEGWVLVANEDYWRPEGEPMWEGGPSGVPQIKRVVQQQVNEWGTRFAMLQAGDVEAAAVPAANRPQADEFVGEFCDYATGECTPNADNPDGPLRKWGNMPTVSRTDVFLTFNVATDENGNNPYIGSGQLDGNGIPPDFFSDVHVRKAMNYCFDYDAFIADAQNGEGARNNGPIILDMLGYNPDGEYYPFDLDQCAAELEQAWGGVLPETGFRFQIAFNTGNVTRQTAAAIFQNNLASINEKYQVEIVGLPWPTFLRSFRAVQLPVSISGWHEDIHDPHNWAQPFTVGTYAGRQALPDDLRAQFQELVTAGVLAADPAAREAIYYDLQKLHHDTAIQVTLSQGAGSRYEQRWVDGFYYNSALYDGMPDAGYMYALGLQQ